MKNTLPPNDSLNSQSKDSYKAQLKKVYQAFYSSPKTMKEVDRETGVMRENICRYCRTLRLQNRLFAVNKRRCTVTKYPKVIAWTSNPDLAPKSNQLRLL
jgi:hypothetical protein